MNPAMPTVSVLIATYNAADFLKRAVSSAQAQTIAVEEILIVDDASTDETVRIARQLATADSRIRIVELKRNGGPSTARNAGLDVARGQWIAVLDADDAYLPDRLEQMIHAALASKADIVVDNFRSYDAATATIGAAALQESSAYEIVSLRQFLAKARPYSDEPDWGLLKPIFRKSFVDDKQLRYPVRSRHGEDLLLLIEAFLQGGRYVLLRKPGYLYTTRSSGFSRTTIDYRLMVQHTESLLLDPRIEGDANLASLLRARMMALNRLAVEYDLARYWRTRDLLSIVRRGVVENGFRAALLSKLVSKLRNAS